MHIYTSRPTAQRIEPALAGQLRGVKSALLSAHAAADMGGVNTATALAVLGNHRAMVGLVAAYVAVDRPAIN